VVGIDGWTLPANYSAGRLPACLLSGVCNEVGSIPGSVTEEAPVR